MSAAATTSGAKPRRSILSLLGRHQAGSLIATAVDFLTMTLAVELFGLSAVVATLLGATCGASTNFQLGRHWIYEAHQDAASGQALRYVVAAATSAAWNALGEHLLNGRLHLNYFAARVVVAVVVSFCWNFPMQRHFVFRHKDRA